MLFTSDSAVAVREVWGVRLGVSEVVLDNVSGVESETDFVSGGAFLDDENIDPNDDVLAGFGLFIFIVFQKPRFDFSSPDDFLRLFLSSLVVVTLASTPSSVSYDGGAISGIAKSLKDG